MGKCAYVATGPLKIIKPASDIKCHRYNERLAIFAIFGLENMSALKRLAPCIVDGTIAQPMQIHVRILVLYTRIPVYNFLAFFNRKYDLSFLIHSIIPPGCKTREMCLPLTSNVYPQRQNKVGRS